MVFAIVLTRLYNHTGMSVLLAVLAPASFNTSQMLVVNELSPGAANNVCTRGRLGYVSP